MHLEGIESASFACAHYLAGVGDLRGPIEALTECVAYKGARCHVVAAHARVDVPDQFAAFGDGDAPL
jgi:hypothetical protein